MAIEFDGFGWDAGNQDKCLKHGLSRQEIEYVLCNTPMIAPDYKNSGQEERLIAVGRTPRDRPAFVAFTVRRRAGQVLLRPISARHMHAREVHMYEKSS